MVAWPSSRATRAASVRACVCACACVSVSAHALTRTHAHANTRLRADTHAHTNPRAHTRTRRDGCARPQVGIWSSSTASSMPFSSRELLSACVRVRACVFVCACHSCMRHTRSLIPHQDPNIHIRMPSWPLRSMRDRRRELVRKIQGLLAENDGVLVRILAARGEEASQQIPRPGGAATASGPTAHPTPIRPFGLACAALLGCTGAAAQLAEDGVGPPGPPRFADAVRRPQPVCPRLGVGRLCCCRSSAICEARSPLARSVVTSFMYLYCNTLWYIMHVCILACMHASKHASMQHACKYAYA